MHRCTWYYCSWSMSRGEAHQLELIGMTSEVEVDPAKFDSYMTTVAGADSADAEADGNASFEMVGPS